jgi:hypothetical protein
MREETLSNACNTRHGVRQQRQQKCSRASDEIFFDATPFSQFIQVRYRGADVKAIGPRSFSSLRGVKNGYEESCTSACGGDEETNCSGKASGEGCEENACSKGSREDSGKGGREDGNQDSRNGGGAT